MTLYKDCSECQFTSLMKLKGYKKTENACEITTVWQWRSANGAWAFARIHHVWVQRSRSVRRSRCSAAEWRLFEGSWRTVGAVVCPRSSNKAASIPSFETNRGPSGSLRSRSSVPVMNSSERSNRDPYWSWSCARILPASVGEDWEATNGGSQDTYKYGRSTSKQLGSPLWAIWKSTRRPPPIRSCSRKWTAPRPAEPGRNWTLASPS